MGASGDFKSLREPACGPATGGCRLRPDRTSPDRPIHGGERPEVRFCACGGRTLVPARPDDMRPSSIDYDDLMHAMLMPRPFAARGWSFEMKMDGFRALARRDGGRVDLISRTGRPLAPAFPDIVGVLKTLPGSWVLDGELVVMDVGGEHSLERARRRVAMKLPKTIQAAVLVSPAQLCVFDVLFSHGRDVRSLPLSERREILAALIQSRPGLMRLGWIDEHGDAALAQARELDLDGIVGKRDDSPYRRGPQATWVKIKNPEYSRRGAAPLDERARNNFR